MGKLGTFLLGLVLIGVGLVLFLSNVTVGNFGLYHYKKVNVGAILLILILISFVVMLVKANIATVGAFILLLVAFIITLLLSLDIRVNKMSAFELILILGTACVGIALTIRSLFGVDKSSKSNGQ